MKNIPLISLLLILLTACAAPMPFATVTVSPFPIDALVTTLPTSIPISTITPDSNIPIGESTLAESTSDNQSVTPTESDLDLVSETSIINEMVNDVPFSVEIALDSSLSPSISKIELNPSFINTKGQSTNQAWTYFVAMTMYKTSSYKGTFDEYMSDIAKARETNNIDDWGKVAVRAVKVNDMSTPAYDPKPTLLLPMCDLETNFFADLRPFNKIIIVYVKTSGVQNITRIENVMGDPGFGANLDGSTLYLYVGLSTFGAFGSVNQTLTQTSSLASWLRTGIVRSENKELKGILFTESTNVGVLLVSSK